MTDQLTLSALDPWLLSGQPVVRFAVRDFQTSAHEYAIYIETICNTVGLPIVTLVIPEPAGVVVQAYFPGSPEPTLVDPLLTVTKGSFPWLFCVKERCRVRVDIPGSLCDLHRS